MNRKMYKTIVSDCDPTMLAKKAFDQIIEQVQSSNLNFQLNLSPFSATISIKKSFVKDMFGNILLPSTMVTETESESKYETRERELLSDNDRLNSEILAMEKYNKANDNTIKILEDKLSKAESSALKTFNDKKNEVTVLKTTLKMQMRKLKVLKIS